MSRLATALLVLIGFSQSWVVLADDAGPESYQRVVQGSVVDDQRHPVTSGRIYFGIAGLRDLFTKEASAAIDATGNYRVELNGIAHGELRRSAKGPMRYLLFAPGFRPGFGKVNEGEGPTILDVKLTPEPWETINFRLTDRNKRPVKEAIVEVGPTSTQGGEMITLDEAGRGQASMPLGRGIHLVARSPSHATTEVNLKANDHGRGEVEIPLFDLIRGRVTDAGGHSLPSVQIGSRFVNSERSIKLEQLSNVVYRG